jgi:hypothetical protein
MATNETKRLSSDILKDDSDVLVAIKKMPDYVPAKAEFSVVNADAKEAAMTAKQDTETEKEIEYGSARDNACAAEWAFHNFILGMKDQVVALYGKDSNEVQAVGLKKKSERAKRKTKKITTPTPPPPPTA